MGRRDLEMGDGETAGLRDGEIGEKVGGRPKSGERRWKAEDRRGKRGDGGA
ncbi:hypothetical protein [Lunatibacter salilacus]|uniref:hypothetical protein n=1 Tax=Lunatibacter salilacus TaxID=2483804 RepID=UPI00131D4F74|nr:hypothetical protein [Lunatibacter salilacus]